MGTTISILQAYPLGTEVEVDMQFELPTIMHAGLAAVPTRRGRFSGLSDILNHPDDNVPNLQRIAVQFAPGMTPMWAKPEQVTPILRDFPALCTPLEDGTVPLDEIRKLWGLQAMNGIDQQVYNNIVLAILNGKEIGHYAYSAEVTFGDVLSTIDYLRSKHFAVGLSADQYIRKEA